MSTTAPIVLPVSRLINVNVTLAPAAAQGQSLNSLLFLGTSAIIDTVSRMRVYTSLAQVATDFGTSADEYLAAALWFSQAPQPTQLLIGRWCKTAASGELLGAPLTAIQQLIATWNAITNGSLTISINGTPQNLTGLNFSAAANMNGVAAVVAAALTGATFVWNSVYNRFVVTSNTTGATSTVSFATAEGTGTDVSSALGLRQTNTGSYEANGLAAETAVAAVTLFDTQFGQQWYGLVIDQAADADHLAVAGYINGATNKHFYGVTTQEATVLTPGDTSDIAYELQQLGYNRVAVQYSSSNAFAIVSALARILTTDYQGQNTVITLMYKQEPGITPENLNSTQIAALEAKNCNVFVSYNLTTSTGAPLAIIEPAVASSGEFIDIVLGSDALAIDLQTALFNLLYQTSTKVPFTDLGMHFIKTTCDQILSQFVTDGFLAPGVWTGNGFGALNTGDTMAKGYYIYIPPVSQQTGRSVRNAGPIQIAAKLAGAVHTVNCAITVNP